MALSILLHPPTALWRRETLAASRGTFWVRMDGASSLRIYMARGGRVIVAEAGKLRQRAIGRAHADHRARMERGPHALRADAAGRRRERTPSGRTRRAVKLRAVAAERRSLDTSLVSSRARSVGRRA